MVPKWLVSPLLFLVFIAIVTQLPRGWRIWFIIGASAILAVVFVGIIIFGAIAVNQEDSPK